MATQSIVGDKSLAFAKRIAKCYRYLYDKKKETVMSKQLLRCGTSIGANVREGLYGQSRKDFISKLHIALKEAGETDYWLDVIHSAEYLTMSTSVATRHNWSKLRSALAAPSVHR